MYCAFGLITHGHMVIKLRLCMTGVRLWVPQFV